MSTNSSITVQQPDNVKTVYCHWDGHLDRVGRMLLENYNSQEAADSIVALGDLSFLDKSIACPEGHSYSTPVEGHSVFYGRDRGDSGCEARVCMTYSLALRENQQQYNYFWDGQQWLVNGEVLTAEMVK